MVGGEHLGCRVAGGGWVAAGADEEESGETGQDGFENGGWEGFWEGHGGGPWVVFDVCSVWV